MNSRLAGHVVIISEQNGQCYLQLYPDNVIWVGKRTLLGKYVFFLCSLILQCFGVLTLRLLMSYIYGATSKARNANVVYIWTYVWQR